MIGVKKSTVGVKVAKREQREQVGESLVNTQNLDSTIIDSQLLKFHMSQIEQCFNVKPTNGDIETLEKSGPETKQELIPIVDEMFKNVKDGKINAFAPELTYKYVAPIKPTPKVLEFVDAESVEFPITAICCSSGKTKVPNCSFCCRVDTICRDHESGYPSASNFTRAMRILFLGIYRTKNYDDFKIASGEEFAECCSMKLCEKHNPTLYAIWQDAINSTKILKNCACLSFEGIAHHCTHSKTMCGICAKYENYIMNDVMGVIERVNEVVSLRTVVKTLDSGYTSKPIAVKPQLRVEAPEFKPRGVMKQPNNFGFGSRKL